MKNNYITIVTFSFFFFVFLAFSNAQENPKNNNKIKYTTYEYAQHSIKWWDKKNEKYISAKLQKGIDGIESKLLGMVKWKDKIIAYQCHSFCKKLKIYIINKDATIENSFDVERSEDKSVGMRLLGELDSQPIAVDGKGDIYVVFDQAEKSASSTLIAKHFHKYSQEGKLLWKQQYNSQSNIIINDLFAMPEGCIGVGAPSVEMKEQLHLFKSSSVPVESYVLSTLKNQVRILDKGREANVYAKNMHYNDGNLVYINARNPLLMKKEKPSLIRYDLGNDHQVIYEMEKKTKGFTSTLDEKGNLIATISSVKKMKKEGDKRKIKYYTGTLEVFSPDGSQISKHVFYDDRKRPYGIGNILLAKNGLLLRWGPVENKLYLTDYKNEVVFDEKEMGGIGKNRGTFNTVHHHEDGVLFRMSKNYFVFVEVLVD